VAFAALSDPYGGRRGQPRVFSHFWKPGVDVDVILSEMSQKLDTAAHGLDISGSMVCVEYPFVASNRRTSIRMAMVAGVCLNWAIAQGADAFFAEPTAWKRATVGHGHASKSIVMSWLRSMHPSLDQVWTNDDEADSLCMALYASALMRSAHLNKGNDDDDHT
jgi:Holliday junction resolvasome RuvABC endonuclease subunit